MYRNTSSFPCSSLLFFPAELWLATIVSTVELLSASASDWKVYSVETVYLHS